MTKRPLTQNNLGKKVKASAEQGKIVVKYETVIQMDKSELATKIRQLQAQIEHMEFHYNQLGIDIESSKEELRQLKELEAEEN